MAVTRDAMKYQVLWGLPFGVLVVDVCDGWTPRKGKMPNINTSIGLTMHAHSAAARLLPAFTFAPFAGRARVLDWSRPVVLQLGEARFTV
jgi:hypothetical protein